MTKIPAHLPHPRGSVPRRSIVTIDGPAGAGKDTSAVPFAERVGYQFVDTGAIYRCVALAADRRAILPADRRRMSSGVFDEPLRALIGEIVDQHDIRFDNSVRPVRTMLCGEDVSRAIRDTRIGLHTSALARRPVVRTALLGLQRSLAQEGGVVMVGRDIGRVVLPDAQVKFWLTASLEERARRRHAQHVAECHGSQIYEEVLGAMRTRDKQDEHVLIPADDARTIDSTGRDQAWVLDRMVEYFEQRRSELGFA